MSREGQYLDPPFIKGEVCDADRGVSHAIIVFAVAHVCVVPDHLNARRSPIHCKRPNCFSLIRNSCGVAERIASRHVQRVSSILRKGDGHTPYVTVSGCVFPLSAGPCADLRMRRGHPEQVRTEVSFSHPDQRFSPGGKISTVPDIIICVPHGHPRPGRIDPETECAPFSGI